MPWSVRKSGDKWVVVKQSDGSVVGTHNNEAKAKRQLVALNINVHGNK